MGSAQLLSLRSPLVVPLCPFGIPVNPTGNSKGVQSNLESTPDPSWNPGCKVGAWAPEPTPLGARARHGKAAARTAGVTRSYLLQQSNAKTQLLPSGTTQFEDSLLPQLQPHFAAKARAVTPDVCNFSPSSSTESLGPVTQPLPRNSTG